MKKHLTYITISLLALTSCANQKQKTEMATTSTTENQQVPKVSFQSLYYSNYGGKEQAQEEIINDPLAFSQAWQESNQSTYPPEKPPKVDFQKHSVIVLHFGQVNHGVQEKKLENVQVDEKQCTVTLSTAPPDPSGYHTMEISNPVMFILTDKITKDLPIEIKYEIKEN